MRESVSSAAQRRSGARPERSKFRRAGRRTNVALFWMLLAAFFSGWLAFGAGRPTPALLITAAHGFFGLAVLALFPWKGVIIRRARRLRPVSLLLVVLVLATVLAGFVQLFAGHRRLVGLTPIQVHVGAALVALPMLAWHVLHHRRQRLHRVDLSRRTVLRSAAGVAGLGLGYTFLAVLSRSTGVRPKAATGSRPVDAGAIPATIWLFDRVPSVDRDAHRVDVAGVAVSVAELMADASDITARLDCTSGWYADATWTGKRLSDLIPPAALASAVSLKVTSLTGYARLFPAKQADRIWLAVACNGAPLSAGTGAPVRLVAPGRRGFWWVKWVAAVELSQSPSWQQPPFPGP